MSPLSSLDLLQLMLIASSVLIAAFFAAAETAITSLGYIKAKHLADQAGKTQAALRLWLRFPGRVLTTILVFNNAAIVFAATIATVFALRYFHDAAISIAAGGITLLVVIFAEVLPKSFGKAHYETFSLLTLRFIYWLYRLIFPIVWVLAEFADLFVLHLGGEPKRTPPITEDELEYLVEVARKEGILADIKNEMMSGVIEFDETKVKEIMTPRTDVSGLPNTASFADCVELAVKTGFSRIPVYDEHLDRVVGIILVKDLLRFAGAAHGNGARFSLGAIMREPLFVPESKSIMAVFKELKASKNHIAIIIDEYGGTAGILTMEDIIEEIVGEIQDEFDVEEEKVRAIAPDTHEVLGAMNIDEFLRYFDLKPEMLPQKPEDTIDTLAGWLTQIVGELPQKGQTVNLGPVLVEVSEVDRHRIVKVLVRRSPVIETVTEPV